MTKRTSVGKTASKRTTAPSKSPSIRARAKRPAASRKAGTTARTSTARTTTARTTAPRAATRTSPGLRSMAKTASKVGARAQTGLARVSSTVKRGLSRMNPVASPRRKAHTAQRSSSIRARRAA
jgi:hypothetical protein